MSELDKYVEEIKEKIEEINNESKQPLNEEEIIMLVYIDLGNRLYFDVDFVFGNIIQKEEILKQEDLNEAFKERKITCKKSSKILEYILKKLDINITTVINEKQETMYKHTYNVIYPKDNSEPYKIDLQNDLKNIQFHTTTRKFGLSLKEKRYVITLQRQKEIHKKIKYITSEKPYTEEYIYMLKYHAMQIDDIYEKIDFVLKNIDPYSIPNTKYLERIWRHKKILDYVIGKEISKILNGIICYKINENQEKEYISCYFICKNCNTYIYLYEEKEYMYKKYTLNSFLNKIKKEKIQLFSDQEIPGLKEKKCIKK